MANKNKTAKNLDFDKSLILFKYFLSLFNALNFEEFKTKFKEEELEEIADDGHTKFIKKLLLENLYSDKLNDKMLLEFDENIVSHTNRINEYRSKKIKWKYFQYLTLLFTELYLYKFFEEREKLLNDLNEFLKEFLKENELSEKYMSKYTFEELDKLAYWNATGSGKTLILHMNILQYNHYMNKTGKNKVNKIIILTPNEGLSEQHLNEIKLSNIPAEIFNGATRTLSSGKKVEIIDIHKIKQDKTSSTGKTFDISAFGSNNLLLVDEGHRGSSGKEWKDIRSKISEDGFVFEYSATFGQSIKETDKDLKEEYSKCILFDYSYRFFYEDYYGKDYKILNIGEVEENNRNIYLTASLLSFYQQIKLFKSNDKFNKEFNIEKPLMLFVGSSVNSVRKDKGKEVSDVLDILLFLNYFVKNELEAIESIERLITANTPFQNGKGQDVFANKFSFLNAKGFSADKIYKDILKEVFNSNISGAEMHVENIKKADGEIGIKIGDNEYFALINIGDTSPFIKLCEANKLHCTQNEFDETEFNKINKDNSSINLLVGSKKFTEGWSSWRVSSIGLMNIGKKQGSQIIQLFGRGVRLKGYGFSLKRSIGLQGKKILRPDYIEFLETLNVFGVKADYMSEFKDYLKDEKLDPEVNKIELNLPVIYNEKFKNKIKVLKVKNGLNFKKDAPNPMLTSINQEYNIDTLENFRKSVQTRPITLDLYTKADVLESKSSSGGKNEKNVAVLTYETLNFLDFNRLFFEIQEYKNQKSLHNLNIDKSILFDILSNKDWYILYCKPEEVQLKINNLRKIENICISLLKKYIDRYYKFMKSDWEKDKLEYSVLDTSDSNFVDEYLFEIDENQSDVINYIKSVESEISKAKNDIEFSKLNIEEKSIGSFKLFGLDSHLYNLLIFIGKKNQTIKVKPINLNEGETLFVETLKNYLDKNKEKLEGKELYLLRNQVGNLGFFEEGNFYPDFIMWLIDGNKQYINFIDPKGIREEGLNSSKIRLSETIKTHQEKLKETDKNIILNSFILSVTKHSELEFKTNWSKEEYHAKNVFFISENMSDYELLESIDMIFNNMR